jgi:hypothetical protein
MKSVKVPVPVKVPVTGTFPCFVTFFVPKRLNHDFPFIVYMSIAKSVKILVIGTLRSTEKEPKSVLLPIPVEVMILVNLPEYQLPVFSPTIIFCPSQYQYRNTG